MTTTIGELDQQQATALRSLVTTVCLEMFSDFGLAAVPVPGGKLASVEYDIVGFIGFTGSVPGCLTVSASANFYRASYPSPSGSPPTEVDLFDWAGETTNQLLGRIKGRFCERGLDFEVSIPTAIRGRDIYARSPLRAGVCNLAFQVGDDVVAVDLEVNPPANGRIFQEPTVPIDCSQQGDLVLF
jgi:CheY-specific phosphatase CheX